MALTSTTTCSNTNPTVVTGGEYSGYYLGKMSVVDTHAPNNTWVNQPFQWASSTCVTTESGYILDIGTSVMLGGILMFFTAYWFVGLVRNKKQWNS